MARYGLRNLELLNEVGLLGEQTQVVHGVWLDDGELEMIRDQGKPRSSIVLSPTCILASGVARVPEMLRMGINVALRYGSPVGKLPDKFSS